MPGLKSSMKTIILNIVNLATLEGELTTLRTTVYTVVCFFDKKGRKASNITCKVIGQYKVEELP